MIQKLHDTGTILIILLSSMIMLYGACGGKVVLEESYSAGVGGAGGAGGVPVNSANSTVQSGSGAGNSTGSFASTTSGSPPPPCATCAEYITNPGVPLCPESEQIFKVFYTCLCAGPCAMQCQDNYCSNAGKISDSCANCAYGVCKQEFNACVNDF